MAGLARPGVFPCPAPFLVRAASAGESAVLASLFHALPRLGMMGGVVGGQGCSVGGRHGAAQRVVVGVVMLEGHGGRRSWRGRGGRLTVIPLPVVHGIDGIDAPATSPGSWERGHVEGCVLVLLGRVLGLLGEVAVEDLVVHVLPRPTTAVAASHAPSLHSEGHKCLLLDPCHGLRGADAGQLVVIDLHMHTHIQTGRQTRTDKGEKNTVSYHWCV